MWKACVLFRSITSRLVCSQLFRRKTNDSALSLTLWLPQMATDTIAELRREVQDIKALEKNMAVYFLDTGETFKMESCIDQLAKFVTRFSAAYSVG